MVKPVILKKGKPLEVKYDLWGKSGKRIWYYDLNGRRVFIDRLEQARAYAAGAGYEGIKLV